MTQLEINTVRQIIRNELHPIAEALETLMDVVHIQMPTKTPLSERLRLHIEELHNKTRGWQDSTPLSNEVG